VVAIACHQELLSSTISFDSSIGHGLVASSLRIIEMIARLLFTTLLAECFTAHLDGREGLGAQPATEESREINEWAERFQRDRNDQWDRLLKEAGKVKGGFSLVVRLSQEPVAVGEKIELEYCRKNVTELPSVISWTRHSAQPQLILVRDDRGKPVRLTAEGFSRISTMSPLSSSSTAMEGPGDGSTSSYLLSADFAFEQPGKYTVLATYSGGRGGTVVARPLVFTLGEKSATGTRKPSVATPNKTAPTRVANPAPGTAEEWNSLLARAGTPYNACRLEGVISPYSPSAVHLVLSVTCVQDVYVRRSWFDNHGAGCTVRAGTVPSNYRILIRDSAGKAVPLTSFGQEFFQRREKEIPVDLLLGCSVGTWLPLDELFCLKSDEEYTVLAVIPEKTGALTGLVSSPLKIRVPQLSIAGLTRPFYGSDELWPKLVARASIPDPTLSCEIIGPADAWDIIRIAVGNRSGHVFGPELASAETTVLVRDSRGKPMFPIVAGDDDGQVIERLDATGFEPAHSKDAVAMPRFPRRYPIIPREPYTMLAAVRLRGNPTAFAVAEPRTFVRSVSDEFGVESISDGNGRPAHAVPKPTPSNRGNWDYLLRFAGKPFGDLQLTAEQPNPDALKVSLVNLGKKSIIVKKWEGIAGYDVQVRSAEGKPLPLTEKGKVQFQGGGALDTCDLMPQHKIEETIPIRDLFEMQSPGVYSVLVSLPVVGEVDAVLTAAPVKIHIGVKSPAATR
jgi:hypothetical protein